MKETYKPKHICALKRVVIDFDGCDRKFKRYEFQESEVYLKEILLDESFNVQRIALDKDLIHSHLYMNSVAMVFTDSIDLEQKRAKLARYKRYKHKIQEADNSFSRSEIVVEDYDLIEAFDLSVIATNVKKIDAKLKAYATAFKENNLVNPTCKKETILSCAVQKNLLAKFIIYKLKQGEPENNLVINELSFSRFIGNTENRFYFWETMLALEQEGLINVLDVGMERLSIEDIVVNTRLNIQFPCDCYSWGRVSIVSNFEKHFFDDKQEKKIDQQSDQISQSRKKPEPCTENKALHKFGDIQINRQTLDVQIGSNKIIFDTASADEKKGIRALALLVPDDDSLSQKIINYTSLANLDRERNKKFLKANRRLKDPHKQGQHLLSHCRKLLRNNNSLCIVPTTLPLGLEQISL